VLDELCCQSHGSFVSYGFKSSYDLYMIRQSVSFPSSTRVSVQRYSENLHLNQKLYDDT
jgi:hypothetical protein